MSFELLNKVYSKKGLPEAILKFGDISYLLPLFYFEILMKGSNQVLKNVVELGTRGGESTVALTTAVTELNEHNGTDIAVLSVDVDCQCLLDVRERLKTLNLDSCWSYVCCDSVDLIWDKPIDFLLIDTDHTEEQTRRELELWSKKIVRGGTIWLHDTQSTEGVRRAALAWLEKNRKDWEWFEVPVYAGLGWLRRRC